jgi:hypothetical protein
VLLLLLVLQQNLTKDDIFKANALGWCIEWVSSMTISAVWYSTTAAAAAVLRSSC